jgi:hypothetical protein
MLPRKGSLQARLGSPFSWIGFLAPSPPAKFSLMPEVGGSSLYPTLALSVTHPEVLRILLSIGPTETMHFQTWHDKAGNAVSPPLAPLTFDDLTFPNLNAPPFPAPPPSPMGKRSTRSLSSYAPTGAPRCTERKRAARRPTGASFYAC